LLPMAMAIFAFQAINSFTDFKKIVQWLGCFQVALAPLGVLVFVADNKALPFFLQNIKKMTGALK